MEKFQNRLNEVVKGLLPAGHPSGGDVELQFPDKPEHGDCSTNIALKLASSLKKPPREIAGLIMEAARSDAVLAGWIASSECAGPGFINFFFSDRFLEVLVQDLRSGSAGFGVNDQLQGQRFLIEFVSANPTGPLTIAHARQAVIGDCLARLVTASGGEAHREYYVNNRGVQIQKLGLSVFLRYLEELGEGIEFPEDAYQGDYIRSLARDMIREYGDRYRSLTVPEGAELFQETAMASILKNIQEDLKDFGVVFDHYFSERVLNENGQIDETLQFLKEHGKAYEKDGALWFASSLYGDDKDRVLIKSDGSTTYLAADIPYHHDKLKRGYHHLIDLMGPDHHGYIARLEAAVEALGYSRKQLRVLIVQLVTLYRGTEQLSMSTRRGQFVTLRELLDEVGVDAGRYFFASRKTDSHLDFDMELARKQTPDNPVFYVQYACARIHSILAKAGAAGISRSDLDAAPFRAELCGPQEKQLVVPLARLPRVVADAASRLEPQALTLYLEAITTLFQRYYSGNNRVLTDDRESTIQKCILCQCVRQVIQNGLTLLGIQTPERM